VPRQPLAEVFGFPINNMTPEASHYRNNKLCPFNNKSANCTKSSSTNPIGVCSLYEGDDATIICPVRFRQDWLITVHAAEFFFEPGTKWTSLPEVRLKNKQGKSAGNIDVVLVAYDDNEQVMNFGALEVQAIYISGNVSRPFKKYLTDPVANANLDWSGQREYPRPDYLSSSRKRLAPQLIYKGGIFKEWGKKQAVAIHKNFYRTLPTLEHVERNNADIAWLIYDLELDAATQRRRLIKTETVYTKFDDSLKKITTTEAGPVEDFIAVLQAKLDKIESKGAAPDVADMGEASEEHDESQANDQ
jgi:hypothetical protein